jgi:hypothetical protein
MAENEKPCTLCHRVLSLSEFYPSKQLKLGVISACKECERAKSRRYAEENADKKKESYRKHREANHDKIKAHKRAEYSRNKERYRKASSEYRKHNLDKLRIVNARWRAEFWPSLRKELISEYGGKCACCGEAEPRFLELDHIFNDGALERRKHKNSRQEVLALKRAGWPKDRHQLLCANCNRGKLLNGGICPHKTKSQS